MQIALLGHRLLNSFVEAMAAGTAWRAILSKPRLAKNASAVVVSR
jgi:hypothetical protein